VTCRRRVVLKFDPSGALVTSFGAGMIVFAHGLHVDRDGNVWVTDGQDNMPTRGRGAPADAPLPPPPAKIIGHQVIKFSPDGTVLLTLGKAGGNRPGEPADPASFYQPNDVITNAAGDIFVCEGHSNAATANARIVKFDRNGKFIKEAGKRGNAPGELLQPHGLAFDSKGRLFVADRSNNRIQIYDQDLNLLDTGWEQTAESAGSGSTGTTCSTRPTRNRGASRLTEWIGSAASASAACATDGPGRSSSSSPTPPRQQRGRWRPKASPPMLTATYGPKSVLRSSRGT
jgi:hypothetical protein